jgi:hypothetical protein
MVDNVNKHFPLSTSAKKAPCCLKVPYSNSLDNLPASKSTHPLRLNLPYKDSTLKTLRADQQYHQARL